MQINNGKVHKHKTYISKFLNACVCVCVHICCRILEFIQEKVVWLSFSKSFGISIIFLCFLPIFKYIIFFFCSLNMQAKQYSLRFLITFSWNTNLFLFSQSRRFHTEKWWKPQSGQSLYIYIYVNMKDNNHLTIFELNGNDALDTKSLI